MPIFSSPLFHPPFVGETFDQNYQVGQTTKPCLPKKEAAVLRRELERLQKYLGGLKNMRRLPDVVVLVDQRRESNAVLEARKLDISLVKRLLNPSTIFTF